MGKLAKIALIVLVCFIFSCSRHVGIIIVEPKKEKPVLTIKERLDTISSIDGEHFRLYRLSNDSLVWINQSKRMFPKDTFK
jgi:hypothetical protein